MYTYSVLLVVGLAIHVVTGASWPWALFWSDYRKPASCQEIFDNNACAQSGVYTLAYGDAYCDMESPCGGGGWTKIADVNMNKHSQQCPGEYVFYDIDNYRTCGRGGGGAGCASAYFSSLNIEYSEVCGHVVAYQWATNDAFQPSLKNDINTYYVDGVSITRGWPRQHIWTLVNGLQDTVTFNSAYQCPCNSDGTDGRVPDFVGEHYYCESGIHGNYAVRLYSEDPLWDNQDCGPLETACCNVGLLPYFYRDLQSPSSDDIEVRICSDQDSISNEDTRVFIIELYVR